MNITFLIGNGFDLNLGLKTTYRDFLKDYTVISLEDDDLIKHFKNSILKDADTWSNAEMAFGKATKQFREEGYNAEDFCRCHEDFCIKLAGYLSKEAHRLNYNDLKDEISTGFLKGILHYKDGFRLVEKNNISMAESKFDGGIIFNFITFNYTSILDSCFKTNRLMRDKLGNRSVRNSLYSNRFGELIPVHGTTNKDMVLGVNDLSQILEPQLFDKFGDEYISQIIKQKTNEMNGENIDKKVFELLKSSDLIYIYGMSIGETDKLWWERICELMKQKNNLHVIIHDFNAPQNSLIMREYRSYEKKAKRRFTDYSNLEEAEKTEIEKRLHIDRTNIFNELKMLVDSSKDTIKLENTPVIA